MNGRNSFFGVYVTPSFEIQLKSQSVLARVVGEGAAQRGFGGLTAGISSPTLSATRKFNFHCGSPILFNFVVQNPKVS